ncbi:hypothetical protein [Nocardia mexicana]|uniref:Uncharacterized protein n=1 Tax=Nocardia mexicana TaxID=279262 RepID=A0A370HBY6_9NOCA|nr:hypothetical protein [Nocardia mexicana]RDI54442.1 hypothetical protein DFR68_102569 [Nocardia mexicana]
MTEPLDPGAERHILLVGIDPALVDFSAIPNLDTDGVRLSRAEIDAALESLGFSVRRCVLDFDTTTEAELESTLTAGDFDCVMIGAGVRAVPENLLLFERVINIVHRLAPKAVISFNSRPGDTVEAARRSLAAMPA